MKTLFTMQFIILILTCFFSLAAFAQIETKSTQTQLEINQKNNQLLFNKNETNLVFENNDSNSDIKIPSSKKEFLIGPTLSLGVFNFISLGVEARINDFWGVSINAGGLSGIDLKDYPYLKNKFNQDYNGVTINTMIGSILHIEGRAIIYPFKGAFFLGSACGIRMIHIETDGTLSNNIAGISLPIYSPISSTLNIKTLYLTPQFGWMWAWKDQLILGTELGVQIPILTIKDEYNIDDSQVNNTIKQSTSYANFIKKTRDDTRYYARHQILPFWNMIKIAWFF